MRIWSVSHIGAVKRGSTNAPTLIPLSVKPNTTSAQLRISSPVVQAPPALDATTTMPPSLMRNCSSWLCLKSACDSASLFNLETQQFNGLHKLLKQRHLPSVTLAFHFKRLKPGHDNDHGQVVEHRRQHEGQHGHDDLRPKLHLTSTTVVRMMLLSPFSLLLVLGLLPAARAVSLLGSAL